MKAFYEQVGGTYTRQGDYEFPDLKVPPEKELKSESGGSDTGDI